MTTDKRKVKAYYTALKMRRVKNHAQKTADHFGITKARLFQILQEPIRADIKIPDSLLKEIRTTTNRGKTVAKLREMGIKWKYIQEAFGVDRANLYRDYERFKTTSKRGSSKG